MAEAAYRLKRSGSTTYQHDRCHSNSSDEDQPDAPHLTHDHTPKQDKRETNTPKSDRKRFFKRKRRPNSSRHISLPDGQGFLERVANSDHPTRRHTLPPLESVSPTPPSHTSHTLTHNILPPSQLDLQPRDDPEGQETNAVITPGGTLSPGVTKLLERVPSLRRTESNGSTRSRRRCSGTGSPLSFSPVKRQISGSGLHGNCPLPSAASSSQKASNKSTPSHDSNTPYSKLDSTSNLSSETDITHSSANAGNVTTTTSNYDDEQPLHTPRRRNPDTLRADENIENMPVNVESSLRSIYSNESSADTRASDGGNDADSESNNSDDDFVSEVETVGTNDPGSTAESIPSPLVPESNESLLYMQYEKDTQESPNLEPSITKMVANYTGVDSDDSISFAKSAIFSHSFSEVEPVLLTSICHSSQTQVSQLISQFESVDDEATPASSIGSKGHASKVMEMPLHMRRPIRREQISGNYSPKLAEEAWKKSE